MRHKKITLRERRDTLKRVFITTSFRASLAALAVLLIILYVIQISTISTKGFDMSTYRAEIRELQQQNDRLEYQIATYRSMASIQERLQEMQLVAVQAPVYLQLESSQVASR